MIKAIVFDLDGMCFHSSDFFSNRLHKEKGVDLEKIIQFFKNEFIDCQKGLKDMKTELEKYFEDWGFDDVDSLLEFWFSDGNLDEGMISIICKLKAKGIVCVLGTTNEKYRMDFLKRKFKLQDIFDHIVVSYEVGHRKPDKEFFDRILEIIGMNANEVIVCDDKEEHADVLKEIGFIPYLYTNIREFKQFLEFKKIISFP